MPWSCILQFSKVLGFHVRDILSLILHKIEIYHCKLKRPCLNLCSNYQYIFIKSEIFRNTQLLAPSPYNALFVLVLVLCFLVFCLYFRTAKVLAAQADAEKIKVGYF